MGGGRFIVLTVFILTVLFVSARLSRSLDNRGIYNVSDMLQVVPFINEIIVFVRPVIVHVASVNIALKHPRLVNKAVEVSGRQDLTFEAHNFFATLFNAFPNENIILRYAHCMKPNWKYY